MPDPITSQVDLLGMILWFALPAYAVLRFPNKNISIPVGTLLFWVIGVVIGSLLEALDENRGHLVTDSIFLLVGWVFGLAYSWMLFGIRCAAIAAIKRLQSSRTKTDI